MDEKSIGQVNDEIYQLILLKCDGHQDFVEDKMQGILLCVAMSLGCSREELLDLGVDEMALLRLPQRYPPEEWQN